MKKQFTLTALIGAVGLILSPASFAQYEESLEAQQQATEAQQESMEAQQQATEAQQESLEAQQQVGEETSSPPSAATESTSQPAEQETEKTDSSAQQAIPLAASKPAQQETLVSSNTIVGATVKNKQGEELGEIEELMVDPQTGRIVHAVLSVGGGWVTDEKRVAIPWETLKVGLGPEALILEMDKEQLQSAAE